MCGVYRRAIQERKVLFTQRGLLPTTGFPSGTSHGTGNHGNLVMDSAGKVKGLHDHYFDFFFVIDLIILARYEDLIDIFLVRMLKARNSQ